MRKSHKRKLSNLEEEYLMGRLPEQNGKAPVACVAETKGADRCPCISCVAWFARTREARRK